MSLSVVSHVLCVTESYKGVVRPLTTTLLMCVCVGTTLVVFFKECVTEKKKVLNNIRSKEVDGDLLRVMEDDELEEHVGLDGLMVKKLRRKMDGVARDEEAENKVAALITFLEKIHLSQYHDRLVNDLGVADMKELPDLVESADFLERLHLKFAEEARFKNAVRQIMHPSNSSATLQPGKGGVSSASRTPGSSRR